MEIILTKQCESLTGTIDRGYGYYVRRHFDHKACKWRFFGQRSKHGAPPNGHWRFIKACAQLAQMKLYIADIRVPANELAAALEEALNFWAALNVKLDGEYNAAEVISLKERFCI